MLNSASLAAPPTVTLPLFLPHAPPDKMSGLIHAATLLGQLLRQGRALDSRALRSAMEAAFGGSDADGAWVWKDAYEALEAAQVLFLRKFGAAMRARAGSAAAMLEMLTRLAGRLASQTRPSRPRRMSKGVSPKPPSAISARHLPRLAEGGRLVAITGHNVGPDRPAWRDRLCALQEKAASSSRRPSPGRPMSAMVRASRRG